MNPAEMNINLNELSHHGILGMKWGIRRFQKYPAGYSGDGKYVGPDGQPRQPTRKEARRDRKYNELKTKIDKWLVDAVNTGDKKTLKRLKKTMTPQEYQSAYDALVKKGISDSVKTGDKAGLKQYKDDVSKNEYKDAKTLADFNDAVNRLDTKEMSRLVSKIKNEDIKESAQRIAAMTELENKKISAIKVESETSAKIAKVATTAQNVANLAGSVKKVYDVVSGIKENQLKKQHEAVKRADEINKMNEENDKKKQEKFAESIIKKGDDETFEKYKNRLTNQQVKDYYERKYLNRKEEIDRAILTGDTKTKIKNADKLGYAPVETINKASDTESKYRAPKWELNTQNDLKKTRDKAADILQTYQSEANDIQRKLREGISPIDMSDPSKVSAWNAEKTKLEQRLARATAAERAANILYMKENAAYESYKANDPTGETWKDSINKKAEAIKSAYADFKLTPQARDAQRQAEAAAKKLEDQNVSAANKVMDLVSKDPEKFLDGSQMFIDPFKYLNK